MSIDPEKPLGGRPSLAQEAETKHIKMEVKADLELAKMMPKAITALAKLVNTIDKLAPNQQLIVIDKIMRANKDYMKAKREVEAAAKAAEKVSKDEEDYYEDDIPMIALTAEDTDNQTIN